MRILLIILSVMSVIVVSAEEAGARIKDLCFLEGAHGKQLNGIGLVVGLNGTGDKSSAALKPLEIFIKHHNITVTASDLSSKNVALVVVTATLPPFRKQAARLNVTVSCLGDASSLRGGRLLQTKMVAHDGFVYVAATGGVSIGGFGNAGTGLVSTGRDHSNIETVGTIEDGGMVTTEITTKLLFGNEIRFALHQPDFTTANRVANRLVEEFGQERIVAKDASTVSLKFLNGIPNTTNLTRIISQIEAMKVVPDSKARVVINERTGTVAVGANVTISPVTFCHAGLSLKVMPAKVAKVNPNKPEERIEAINWTDPVTGNKLEKPPLGIKISSESQIGSLTVMEGTTVEAIANAMNALGARPKDIVAIFQAIHRLGALHAELEIM